MLYISNNPPRINPFSQSNNLVEYTNFTLQDLEQYPELKKFLKDLILHFKHSKALDHEEFFYKVFKIFFNFLKP
ncbi:MAG: hypothetical protein ACKO47_01180 [Alphaproteobacteria bacterium]